MNVIISPAIVIKEFYALDQIMGRVFVVNVNATARGVVRLATVGFQTTPVILQ